MFSVHVWGQAHHVFHSFHVQVLHWLPVAIASPLEPAFARGHVQ